MHKKAFGKPDAFFVFNVISLAGYFVAFAFVIIDLQTGHEHDFANI
jgi:hypothetical protein